MTDIRVLIKERILGTVSEILVDLGRVVGYVLLSWTQKVFATMSSWEQSIFLGTDYHDQINVGSSGLDKFLYCKISLGLQ